MFNIKEKSTFKYWFAHWCAFQMTALNLKCWKFRFLFHDIEKPWLKIIIGYERMSKLHKNHSKHHLDYALMHIDKADWLQMVIDWECCRYTKEMCPLTSREELQKIINSKQYTDKEKEIIFNHIYPILNMLKL